MIVIDWDLPGIIAHACRPGRYPDGPTRDALEQEVEQWVRQVRLAGIRSILCLLEPRELDEYRTIGTLFDLFDTYRRAGFEVAHLPVSIDQDITEAIHDQAWQRFTKLSVPVLVHCSDGVGRSEVIARRLAARYRATHRS